MINVIKSQERTAHCDPEVMPIYGVAILPLINMPKFQIWTRNGTKVAGSLESVQSLQNILGKVNEYVCAFG